MWSILGNYSFSQTGLNKRYHQARQLLLWESAGWTREDVKQIAKRDLQLSDFCIGSQVFHLLWRAAYAAKKPQELLTIVLEMAAMPEELSGDLQENQKLVGRFSNDLAPDHAFWHDFSLLVQEVFPKDELSAKTNFAKRIHQFRYVISSQQAQYIRKHFKENGMTDKEALAIFLKRKRYSLMDKGRLHQKIKYEADEVIYPDGQISLNLKVLLHRHTEFILDSQGNFLNEADAEVIRQNGIINGASFNYGTFKRHVQLDVAPVKPHDPTFRRKLAKSFRAPNTVRKFFFRRTPQDFERSFFTPKGLYAQNGRSLNRLLKKEAREFRKLVRNFPS
ncbi:DUF3114 domain-containing protein [Streptococcus dentiloxodontae]